MAFSRRGFIRAMGASLATRAMTIPFSHAEGQSRPESTTSNSRVVRLNSNENAYGPSSFVKAEVQKALVGVNRYPGSRDELTRLIAEKHNVEIDRVVLGCGSTEIIRAVASYALRPEKSLITASPTFEAMGEYSQGFGANVIQVPLTHELAHDLETMHGRINATTAIIYICNPNNPTASITPRQTIQQFLGSVPTGVLVVIDEAYHHFAPLSATYQSFLDQPVANQNLVVLRTFSRLYGLAGLRIGYAITSPDVAKRIRAQTTRLGISEVGLRGAIASLQDEQGTRLAVKRNADDRQEFFNQAMARMLKPIDSKTNFVMMDVHHPAVEIIEHFRKNNVLIGRPFPPMNTYIRVSLGMPDEMHEFWRVWDTLPFSHGMRM